MIFIEIPGDIFVVPHFNFNKIHLDFEITFSSCLNNNKKSFWLSVWKSNLIISIVSETHERWYATKQNFWSRFVFICFKCFCFR